ncbi:helix-turn-helix domain-containing protein [Nocardia sp. alder85J]|uniref:helix-turn-helix domain-containing protein n=1 Tax=Nocardia sp. alder85J TaxID=2862949 RepID=UPI001CD48F5A|nr:helix-turn-helix transcriptional regulator [Nocardia sp. alder85J]MCX4098322.1 helix-turn-helix transcriptional regulator [Nocardia sp. alder85J]
MDPIELSASAAASRGMVQESVKPPSLRGFLQDARKSVENWPGKGPYPSQEDFARRVGLTLSYYGKLETGERADPTRSVLEGIATELNLDAVRRGHLFRLSGLDPVGDLPSAGALRQALDPLTMDIIDRLDADRYVAIFDTQCNLLRCNDMYRQAFPGMEVGQNSILWHFEPSPARKVLVEWEREAEFNVYWFRYLLCPYRDTPWASEMLQRLSRNPWFRRYWAHEARVVSGRSVENSAIHLRDLHTQLLSTLRVSQVRLGNAFGDVIVFVGAREEYSGPELPHE